MTALDPRDLDIPRLVLVGLTLTVAVAVLFAGATTGSAFNAFNPSWDGTSELRSTADDSGADPVVLQNATRYEQYGANATAFVLAPDRSYTDSEAARVRSFVDRGGTLVVADRDGPHGSALLESIGADARPNGTLLRDEQQYYRSPALPVAPNVSDHPRVAGVDSITLNHGTAVEAGNATVLVASSPFAYLDVDNNSSISETETLRSYPVVTIEQIGDGAVIVVGDPSVFINVMQQRPGNEQFTDALVNGSDHAIVDVSHASSPPPLVNAVLTIRDSVLLQTGVGVGTVAIVGLGVRFLPRRREPDSGPGEFDRSLLAAGYARLYADLDSETIRRLTEGVLTRRGQAEDDD